MDADPPKYSYPWFISRFEQAQRRAGELAFSVDKEVFLQRPAPERWSAAECLGHLIEFGNIYYKNIETGLKQATGEIKSSQKTFKPRLLWRWVICSFEPPYKMKVKTIAAFKPDMKPGYSRAQTLESFSGLQERLVDQLQQCRQHEIDLAAIKVGNPALPLLKMTLSECYAVAEAHQRRHLWQAEQTLKKIKAKS